MTELPISLQARDGTLAEKHGRRRLDQLSGDRVAKHLVLFRPTETVVADLMAKARLSIPGLAATEEVQRVLRYNPDCMFAVSHKSRFNPEAPVGEAFIAMLPLTKLGLQLLAAGALNTSSPDTRLLAKAGERPAGIYIWGLYTPGTLVGGVALFMEKIASAQYAGINLYSRPNTEAGERFNESVGLTKGTSIGPLNAPHLWVFNRAPQTPLYDSYAPDMADDQVSVTIARDLEDLARVIAIRSAVYIGEQECPYEEEFDGNDLAATHLIGYVGDEPVGCLRVRYFADFAKIERLAIRQEFRKTRTAVQLVRAGFRLCQKKGYTRIYGHSQKRLVNFWSRFGFRVTEGGKSFVFSDFDYVEIMANIERDPDCIKVGTDPYVIIRPEGRWHLPGILEYSASRPVTRPSVTRQH
jgi:predicted GNAT family N-acyltransferase